MLNSIHDYNTRRTRSLHATIAVVVAILVLTQTLMIYLVLSTKRLPSLEARPDTCDRFDQFEMQLPNRNGRCLPVRYTPNIEA